MEPPPNSTTSSTSAAAPSPESTSPPKMDSRETDSPQLGLSIAWKSNRAGVSAREFASVLTGKALKLDAFSIRADLDLPITRGRWGGLATRYFVGFKKLDGGLPAVTLGDLTKLSPGLAGLISELSDTLGILGEDFKRRGEEALKENIADQVQLSIHGADLGIALVSTGPTTFIRDPWLAVNWFEFSVGAFGHLSHGKITVTDHDKQNSETFLGWGLGGFLCLAPIGINLNFKGVGRFFLQPVAAEAGLFVLLNGPDLVAADVYLSLSTRLGYGF